MLINFSDIQNLDAATPELWNTRYGAILDLVNGKIDSANLASGAVTSAKIANDALLPAHFKQGTGSTWAWTTYTPTWQTTGTAPAIGNGTIVGAYFRIGNTIVARLRITYGSSTFSGTGSWRLSMPVPPHADIGANYGIGSFYAENSGVTAYGGVIRTSPINTAFVEPIYPDGASTGSHANVTNTGPFGWGVGDYLAMTFTYEAA